MAAFGIPATLPRPRSRTTSRSSRLIGVLSLIHSARPRAPANMASVAMNGTMRP